MTDLPAQRVSLSSDANLVAGITVGTLGIRFEIGRGFEDQGEHFLFRHGNRVDVSLRVRLALDVRDTAAMPEDLLNRNFPGIRNLRQEFVEGVGQL